MRTIAISTAVFAAIWQARQPGEESENDILSRFFNVPPEAAEKPAGGRMAGFYDERSGVHFPERMRIHRTYKGEKREAIAHLDRWFVPATGQSFHSLHKLSQSVVGGNENAWTSWKYKDENGVEHSIDNLRKKLEQGGS